MDTKITTPVIKGLIISLILIVLDLVAGFAHFKFATWYRWIPTLIIVIGVIWACINFGSQKDNNVTYGEVFTHGFKTSAVIACITVVFAILSILVIFPETRDLALEQARKQMEEKGDLSSDMIDKSIDITRRMFIPFAIIGIIIFTLIAGVIASLIGAAVTNKKPLSPFENQPK